jgi:hypothetical protein
MIVIKHVTLHEKVDSMDESSLSPGVQNIKREKTRRQLVSGFGRLTNWATKEMDLRREVSRVLADVLATELDNRGILTSRQSGPREGRAPRGLRAEHTI